MDTFGLRLYFVPAAASSSALVLTIAGIGLQGSTKSKLELSLMIFDGFLAANSLVAATIAPSMIPSSSAKENNDVTIPPSWACLRSSLSVLRAETHDL